MESEALTKAELSALVEGWMPRGVVALQDAVSNASAALGGDIAARTSPEVVLGIGAILQIGDALAGPRHPWLQTFLGKPGVGMVDAGLAIKTFLRRKAKQAAEG